MGKYMILVLVDEKTASTAFEIVRFYENN